MEGGAGTQQEIRALASRTNQSTPEMARPSKKMKSTKWPENNKALCLEVFRRVSINMQGPMRPQKGIWLQPIKNSK